jgi:hypothetical protein
MYCMLCADYVHSEETLLSSVRLYWFGGNSLQFEALKCCFVQSANSSEKLIYLCPFPNTGFHERKLTSSTCLN